MSAEGQTPTADYGDRFSFPGSHMVCKECGALVWEGGNHAQWHDLLRGALMELGVNVAKLIEPPA